SRPCDASEVVSRTSRRVPGGSPVRKARTPAHPVVEEVTARIAARSAATRSAYLARMAAARAEGPVRAGLACSNPAHGFAACAGVGLGRCGGEVIAMATGIALSDGMFDGALLLGVCDKIVPGLLIGALSFGHLPAILVPAGPMTSGLPNKEKARVRQLYAEGRATREDLLDAEAASYHSAGTCTFYGTANSNQLVVEVMGLHLPGATFVQP